MAKPALKGVRVLAFEQAAAGPFATQLLADMGADVIKIERPGSGDTIRSWDRAVRGMSSGFVWLNRGKRSLTLNIKSGEGREIFDRLVNQSDVFLTNFAAAVAQSQRFEYDDLKAINPRLIYCALTGYGLDGPYRDVKAYDLLIQGETGLLLSTGYPDAPAKVSVPISDIAAAMYSALGIALALYQREKTGEGQLIDVSMFDSMLSWMGYFPHHYWHQGEEPERVGMRHHYMVPYGPYLASDGRYVNIAVASQTNWELFCRNVIERPDLIEDPRFVDSPARRENRTTLERLIEEVIAERDADVWIERLRAARLPYGEVRGIAEVLAHPQVAARKLIREVESPVGRVPTIESALRMSGSPVASGSIPGLGTETDEVLRELGYNDDTIARLREDGAI
jgi:itaconate CoA-transferase